MKYYHHITYLCIKQINFNTMQTLTLYISLYNLTGKKILTDEQIADIKAYLSKWVHIFGYKIPVKLEYHFVERDFGSVVNLVASHATRQDSLRLPYWNKELCEIGCSFTNLATLGLDLLIGAGVILEYNIQDITDIKDSKLSIDCDDLIDFRKVEIFVQNPCIAALRNEAAQIGNTDNDAILKRKGEIMANIKRYDFTLYNYLAFRSYLLFNNLLQKSPYHQVMEAYQWMFNANVPLSKRLEMAMEIFCRAINDVNNDPVQTENSGILLDLYKAYAEILVIFEKHDEGFDVLEKYHNLVDSLGMLSFLKFI